jgi:hypothetical protein
MLGHGSTGVLKRDNTRTRRLPETFGLFLPLISHQPVVLFSQNKSATSNQSAVLFSQNKPAPAISHQPNDIDLR